MAGITQEKASAALTGVAEAMREQFGDEPKAADRLAQLDAALSTARMCVEHLYDEDTRRRHDKAERVRLAEAGE